MLKLLSYDYEHLEFLLKLPEVVSKEQKETISVCMGVQHTYVLLLIWGFLKVEENHAWQYGQRTGSVTRKLQA